MSGGPQYVQRNKAPVRAWVRALWVQHTGTIKRIHGDRMAGGGSRGHGCQGARRVVAVGPTPCSSLFGLGYGPLGAAPKHQ